MHRAVFLDKDGTLVHDVPYNVDPDRIRLAPGVAQGLRLLQDSGYRLVVVTNQSGVARGYFKEAELRRAFARLQELLQQEQVTLDDIYYCPHHPQGSVAPYAIACDCRKPRPGLIVRAAYDHDIELGRSWFVGDILDDVEAGQRAGCRTVLINNGGETEWINGPYRTPHHIVSNLAHAARAIIKDRRRESYRLSPVGLKEIEKN